MTVLRGNSAPGNRARSTSAAQPMKPYQNCGALTSHTSVSVVPSSRLPGSDESIRFVLLRSLALVAVGREEIAYWERGDRGGLALVVRCRRRGLAMLRWFCGAERGVWGRTACGAVAWRDVWRGGDCGKLILGAWWPCPLIRNVEIGRFDG